MFATRFQKTNLIQIEYFKIVDPNNKDQFTFKWSMQYNVEFFIFKVYKFDVESY